MSLEWILEACSTVLYLRDLIWKASSKFQADSIEKESFLSNNTDWIMQWKCVLISFDFMLSYIVLCPSENFQEAQNISYSQKSKKHTKNIVLYKLVQSSLSHHKHIDGGFCVVISFLLTCLCLQTYSLLAPCKTFWISLNSIQCIPCWWRTQISE